MSFFDDCNPVDCALEAVESIGLNISEIGILKREWTEGKIGCGEAIDTLTLFSPTPRIIDIRNSHKNKEAGLEKRGDITVSLLSRTKYQESDIDCISEEQSIEFYYYIDKALYEVVDIVKKLTHWDVTVRRSKKRQINLENN